MKGKGGGAAVYGLGMFGAVIYYLQNAAGLSDVLLGLFKALLWPAFVVYRLLGYLGM